MRVAIIGAGLAGLAVCRYLCLHSEVSATLFDPKGIGGGASGVSTGLLHPFVGRRASRSWRSKEGMEETLSLLDLAEKAGGVPVAERKGIFRPAITDQQLRDFEKAASFERAAQSNLSPSGVDQAGYLSGGSKELTNPYRRGEFSLFEGSVLQSDLQWVDHPEFGKGLWIPSGIAVYSRTYLDGLWLACKALGVNLVKEPVLSLDALEEFDRVIIAAGFETIRFPGCEHFPLQATKGQTAIYRWSKRPSCSLVSQGHITPTENPDLCQIGSTYERDYTHLNPEESAGLFLREKAAQFYPPASQFELVEVRSGVRISRPKGYRPIVERVSEKAWAFTGLGSRGMLYHAWIGKALAEAVVQDLPSLKCPEIFGSLASYPVSALAYTRST